ncbi:DUF6544 family protein [Planomicrobium sp. CPCC 101079]|uniref:DUF6920 family protein n=1 Tax=Planomicrobium sp. CPCC 101079 TaxID=2599618 RepID=UPI0011B67A2A|nr:DUF6544 family protein [Planomicrobium sp. CPCC 101079]TWT13292.1 hypothetical protein FQV28_02340 [Planomicrobium sp. CPCC 101079]
MRGIFAIFTAVLAVLYRRSVWNFTAQNKKGMGRLLMNSSMSEPAAEIGTLPMPVQRWLKKSGAAVSPAIKSVRLKQAGLMRLKPEQQKWMKAEAEQVITIDPPSFIWTVTMKMSPFIRVIGRDSFKEGKAQMLIKLAALVPITQVEDDAKTNESALQRFLMEMAWYPTAALLPYVTWKALDDTTAEAAMSYNGVKGSAVFHVDEQGELVKVVASRFKDNGAEAQRFPCVAEIKRHMKVDGVTVPEEIEITWLLEEGPFTWYKFKVHAMEFY